MTQTATYRTRTLGSAAEDSWRGLGRKWKLSRLIHRGEATCVYTAKPVLSLTFREPLYVIKIVRRGKERHRPTIDALAREVTVAGSVTHENLVSIVESHSRTPPYHIIYPRLPGQDLTTRIQSSGRLSIPLALSITRQIAAALRALHDAGWVHGDVKPGNILASDDGRATLIDLGFAQRIGDAPPDRQISATEPAILVGSLAYLPPESTLREFTPTAACDIYSLGVTLYELLAGKPPFISTVVGGSAAELIRRHREERPRDLRELRPEIPKGVADLTQRMLSKNPQRRPASGEELIEQVISLEIETFAQRA